MAIADITMLTMGAEAYPPSDGVPVGMGVGTTWCV